jgi:hypothetical protein
MEFSCNRVNIVWLRIKHRPGREVIITGTLVARHDDDFDRGPPVSNSTCELHSVHAPWHVYVGEQDPYIGAGLQDGDGLICIGRLNDIKSGILYEIDCEHPHQWLILDDEHNAFASSKILAHSPLLTNRRKAILADLLERSYDS